jgi:hypothetical protein
LFLLGTLVTMIRKLTRSASTCPVQKSHSSQISTQLSSQRCGEAGKRPGAAVSCRVMFVFVREH